MRFDSLPRLLRALVLLVLATCCARADNMVWQNPNGVIWNNFYTSPYYAYDNSLSPSKLLSLFCLDYNHEVAPPFSWVADLNTLAGNNISKYQYGGSYPGAATIPWAFTQDSQGVADPHAITMQAGSDNYHRYLEAAWLFTNILNAMAKSPEDTTAMQVSQVAAWDLFVDSNHIADLSSRIDGTTGVWTFANYSSNTSITNLDFEGAVDEALNAAQTAVLGGWTPTFGWSVVTANSAWVQNSNNGALVQEFLTPFDLTPEPGSIVLLGTAVIGLFFLLRRRRLAS